MLARVLKLCPQIFSMTYSAFVSHQCPCFQWVTIKGTSVTAEVTHKFFSLSFRSPLQQCICPTREIIDPRREGADEVPKGYRIVEQTRAHHFR